MDAAIIPSLLVEDCRSDRRNLTRSVRILFSHSTESRPAVQKAPRTTIAPLSAPDSRASSRRPRRVRVALSSRCDVALARRLSAGYRDRRPGGDALGNRARTGRRGGHRAGDEEQSRFSRRTVGVVVAALLVVSLGNRVQARAPISHVERYVFNSGTDVVFTIPLLPGYAYTDTNYDIEGANGGAGAHGQPGGIGDDISYDATPRLRRRHRWERSSCGGAESCLIWWPARAFV
jgi:hypothetical protein